MSITKVVFRNSFLNFGGFNSFLAIFIYFFGNTAVPPSSALTTAAAHTKQFDVKLIKYFAEICQGFSLVLAFECLACAVNAYIFHYL